MQTATAMRPLNDHVVIQREESEDQTPGGIVLPDASREQPTRGRVVAVGNGVLLQDGTRSPLGVAEGDTVTFSSYGGTEVELDGETLIVLRESDILLAM